MVRDPRCGKVGIDEEVLTEVSVPPAADADQRDDPSMGPPPGSPPPPATVTAPVVSMTTDEDRPAAVCA
jgi:hypothetical protein